uniref:Uncharacterized protein n=1 Tax=Saimiri boliviensis boliviensis TaxID=39432 RepID=A0A2K6UG84_SAIBB
MPLRNTKASQGTGREMTLVSWGGRGLLPGSESAGGTVNQSWHPHPGQRVFRTFGLRSVLGIRFSSRALASCLFFNWEHRLPQDQNPHSPPRSYLASL